MRRFHAALAVFLMGMMVGAPAPVAAAPYKVAVLQGVDKITGRISTFEAVVGEPATFGTLEIEAAACHKTPPEETPETTVFLTIRDTDIRDEDKARIFKGWMFASSPAINPLQHKIYDVWVIDCKSQPSS